MSISIKRKKIEKLRDFDQVQTFGMQQDIAAFDSKQFGSQHKTRIVKMLSDSYNRLYNANKEGAELLLEHISSEESDKTYWSSPSPETEVTGERKQKSEKLKVVTLDFFAQQDLTEDEFNKLAKSGAIDSKLVYFSQLRCGTEFGAVLDLGSGIKCKKVLDLTSLLQGNKALADKVQPIKIIWYQGKITTVDNRRLKAHREAKADIRYEKETWDTLSESERQHFDPQAPASNCNVT